MAVDTFSRGPDLTDQGGIMMSSLRAKDLRAVLEFTVAALRVRTFAHVRPLLAEVAGLVGSATATLTQLNLRTQHEVAVFWPAHRPDLSVLPAYAALGHTHPLREPLSRLAAAPRHGLPLRLSDVVGARQWQATPLYREAMYGTSDQLCLPLSFHGPVTQAITLSRTRGTFTDRQRDLLAASAAHVGTAMRRVPLHGQFALQLAPQAARVPFAVAGERGARPGLELSRREGEVLRLVAEGLTDAQIARRLGVRPATVSKHLHRVYSRLGLRNRAEAARLWADHGGERVG
ncbi:helix-turn-helix transcriptional regulator [Nonomuraea soli]|uniref:DNA-binding CsgD family transcriptional regulator n=1 Tax=Nonomuraea soli TaxID=1032476 RepID=A0A7W0CQE6_9ACTN|nr:LuxR C-terminal-related transcriptional regulator [Nonomuraea soli]MBA2895444.1 DNA-binding CsgD family transcriptional regulator [Nonomuraea soli]